LLRLPISEPKGILFETALEPAPAVVDNLRKEVGIDESEINILYGKINKVAVGVPYHKNLISNTMIRIRKYHVKSKTWQIDTIFIMFV
jgi:hypothetical protein